MIQLSLGLYDGIEASFHEDTVDLGECPEPDMIKWHHGSWLVSDISYSMNEWYFTELAYEPRRDLWRVSAKERYMEISLMREDMQWKAYCEIYSYARDRDLRLHKDMRMDFFNRWKPRTKSTQVRNIIMPDWAKKWKYQSYRDSIDQRSSYFDGFSISFEMLPLSQIQILPIACTTC